MNNSKETITCPNCKGKGHVMDGAAVGMAILSVFLLPVVLFGNNESSLGRERCDRCNGKGYVKI